MSVEVLCLLTVRKVLQPFMLVHRLPKHRKHHPVTNQQANPRQKHDRKENEPRVPAKKLLKASPPNKTMLV
jgi:hypothetical protein